MMLSDNEPCILGQTTVPEETLKHNGWAKKLGSRGLGEALLNLPNVSRSAFNFSFGVSSLPMLREYNIDLPKNTGIDLWVRRSSFLIENRPLWVVEVFLPKICKLKETDGQWLKLNKNFFPQSTTTQILCALTDQSVFIYCCGQLCGAFGCQLEVGLL